MTNTHKLLLKKLGINTYKEAVIYMREDCYVCRSEGFEAQARILVTYKNKSILATLNTIESDLLKTNESSLSIYAWDTLNAREGEEIQVSHPKQLNSLGYIRAKIYGHELNKDEIDEIVKDVVDGSLSDIQISAFLGASGDARLSREEILNLTQSMIDVGTRLTWSSPLVVDKHCVGGLPGNRTTIIVVPIVTAFGLTMPKTSSRAITSPAGTADTMEVIAPVDLDLVTMRKVVERENGCIIWGGSVALSPADDILIRIERALDLDSEGQLVASILSKKIAAGSSHILLDIPVGPTAKVRTLEAAKLLQDYLESIGKELGVEVRAIFTDGLQPVGRGIGPALEAKDVLAVLQGDRNAPQDLRDRALTLAGRILEFSSKVKPGTGKQLAKEILESGQAWKKFQAICVAQGGMFELPTVQHTYIVSSKTQGRVVAVDNRYLTRIAKLAGAPKSKAAGVEFLTPIGTEVILEQPLFVIHSQTKGELEYAVNFLEQGHQFVQIKEDQ
jgi:thymidine phosphorylase